jgi:hypothetical protein
MLRCASLNLSVVPYDSPADSERGMYYTNLNSTQDFIGVLRKEMKKRKRREEERGKEQITN